MTRPAPVAVQPPADDLYDETMTHIALEKERNERKPRAIAAKEPAPVVAAAELADADFDGIDALVARERALGARFDRRKPHGRVVAAPADEAKDAAPPLTSAFLSKGAFTRTLR